MPRNSRALPPEIADVFAASEGLYHATRAVISAGRTLPAGAQSPSHIALSVVMLALKQQIECPAWARNCVLRDWARFESFECASIGEAFNVPETKYPHTRRAERLCAAVYHRVRELKKRGVPQKDNAKQKGSLSLVGDEFHMSPAQVKQRMSEWLALCRVARNDPDALPKYSDAGELIARTITRAIEPRVKKTKKV